MTYQPVGRCIYCGTKPPPPLSREHILAESLGGTEVLPAASCAAHRDVTSKFELQCARMAYGTYRAAEGLQSKRSSKPIASIEVKAWKHDGTEIMHRLPLVDWPRLHLVVHYPPPSLLTGLSVDPTSLGHLKAARGDDAHYQRTLSKYGWKAFENHTGGFLSFAFQRMLAKTAHAHAVAHFGLDGFTSIVRAFIDCEDADTLDGFTYVGGFEPRQPQLARALSHRIEGQYIVVTISMRAFKSFPAYQVVVGRTLG